MDLAKVISSGEIPVQVYVDSQDLVRRVVYNETVTTGGKSVTSVIQIDFLDYGAQPAPSVPPADQVENLSAFEHSFPF